MHPVDTGGSVDAAACPVSAGMGGWALDVGAAAYMRGTGVFGWRGALGWGIEEDWISEEVADARMSSDAPTKRPFASGRRV